ncbi:MAG: hypothetical protein HN509_17610 [Halobacteriovoraceae bacterium]|nr:hypothetical protein [Halobacteriovoraceae bacterium]MBT5094573.1 hypothetical protein [Halobacteriovoraceae bacterium]
MSELKYLLVFVFLISLNANAGSWDSKATQLGRTYPQAAVVGGEFGYSQKFWNSRKSPVLYGHLRPVLRAKSSGLVNSFSTELNFAPISFLNFSIGRRQVFRNAKKLQGLDCEKIICDGKVKRDYLAVQFGMAYKKLYSFLQFKRAKLAHAEQQNLIADEQSTLVYNQQQNRLKQLTFLVGLKQDPKNSYGLLYLDNEIELENSTTKTLSPFWQRSFKKWKVMTLPGIFQRSDKKRFLSLIIRAEWTFKKGLSLF